MVIQSLEHSATRLMGVGTVAETTVFGEMEYLLEIACQFLPLDIERAEALDTWSVNDIATGGQGKHLTERSGVHTRVMSIRNLCRSKIGVWQKAIDKC